MNIRKGDIVQARECLSLQGVVTKVLFHRHEDSGRGFHYVKFRSGRVQYHSPLSSLRVIRRSR